MVDMDTIPTAIDANYDVWTDKSVITLTTVPWDNNYRDIVNFDSQKALDAFIDGQVSTNTKIDNSRYARADEPVFLQIPMTKAYGYNYIRVQNPRQSPVGNEPMSYYYFVTGIQYVAPGTTMFMVQMDVWQTFGRMVTFGNCYIEAGHIGIANESAFNDYGREYMTIPEGLDTGAEHRNVMVNRNMIMSPNSMSIMVTSNIDFRQDPGDKNDPHISTAGGQSILGTPQGANTYVFKTRTDFTAFMTLYQDYPWITQGIMQIAAVPQLENIGYKLTDVTLPKAPNVKCYQISAAEYGRGVYKSVNPNWRESPDLLARIPERYHVLKKLWTYPYMSIEITTNSGTPIVLKPELWQSEDAEIAIKTNVVAPGQRIVIYPRHYNGDNAIPERRSANADGTFEYYEGVDDYLEVSTSVGNLPTFAVVSNAGVLALANQAHGLAQQYRSADWGQQKALAGNQTSYDQGNASQANTSQQGDFGRQLNNANTNLSNRETVARTAWGAAQSVATGNVLGAIGSVGDAAIDINVRNQRTGITNAFQKASVENNVSTAAYINDTNKSLADFSARGDYAQANAAINARVQDTAMTPPFTAGQAGGDMFNFVFDGIHVYVKWKIVPPATLRAVGEYFFRYGYQVRQFARLPKSLMVMENFTYWRLTETYITAAGVPEGIKQAIRGIFEKGVTVWRDPKKMGQIDIADNAPLKGYFL